MDVKIGFNLLAWSSAISGALYPVVERLSEIGYQGVECAMGSRDRKAYTAFGHHAKELGLEVSCVLALGRDTDPISHSAAVREKALAEIKWAIDRAVDLDAALICGPFHSAFANFSGKPPADAEIGRSADVLRQAGEYAAEANIILALEAINRFECYLCNTASQLSGLIHRTGHPNVRAMFDTHHANIEEKNFSKAIKDLAPVLAHVHISENDRGTPGAGHLPWEQVFTTLAGIHYTGWLTIEAFTRNDAGFANSINVWREYSAPWDMAESGLKFIQENCEKYKLGYISK